MYERSYRSTWSSTFFLRRHRLKTRRTADSLSSLKSPVRLVIRRPQFWWTQRREKNEVIGWEANQSSLLNCFQLTLTLVWWAIGIEWCPSVSEWMSEWVSEWVSPETNCVNSPNLDMRRLWWNLVKSFFSGAVWRSIKYIKICAGLGNLQGEIRVQKSSRHIISLSKHRILLKFEHKPHLWWRTKIF